ncbi:MAG TPA: hypothetical protein VID95_11880 [Candidatus Limnocylindrales bacterium]
MPTIGLAELMVLGVYLIVIGLIIALPFWSIGQIRRNRSRVDELERRIVELESQARPERP